MPDDDEESRERAIAELAAAFAELERAGLMDVFLARHRPPAEWFEEDLDDLLGVGVLVMQDGKVVEAHDFH